jgi:hypothetical protein
MLPWHLEDWITDVGANVLDKRLASPDSLSHLENLIYEVWLLDTEARNGGLSQYFGNHGLSQWQSCLAATEAVGLKSFVPFANAVASLISETEEPYLAIVKQGDEAEDLWYGYQASVVEELQSLCKNAL